MTAPPPPSLSNRISLAEEGLQPGPTGVLLPVPDLGLPGQPDQSGRDPRVVQPQQVPRLPLSRGQQTAGAHWALSDWPHARQ